MPERPYTLLSCGMSLDGYLDAATDERLMLSNEADLDRVDTVRADSDAILVGAATVRNDNPRLLVRAPARRAERVARGLPPTPDQGDRHQPLPARPGGRTSSSPATRRSWSTAPPRPWRRPAAGSGPSPPSSTAVGCVDMCRVSEDLHVRGVRRLMVEGGGQVLTQFLTAGLADELHLVVAPFFVGDSRARRLVGDGSFPWNPDHRASLAEVRQIGDVVLLRYALSDRSLRASVGPEARLSFLATVELLSPAATAIARAGPRGAR